MLARRVRLAVILALAVSASLRAQEVPRERTSDGDSSPGGRWKERSAIPAPVTQGACASDGRFLYVFGGNKTAGGRSGLLRYDPESDKWTPLAPMPEVTGTNAGAYHDGCLYSFGNWATYGTVCRYSIKTDSWEILPVKVRNHSVGPAAVTLGDKIYLFGGFHAWAGPSADASEFDPKAGTIKPLAKMPEGVGYVTAVAAGGKIYVLGGGVYPLGSVPNSRDYCFEYDPAADRWARKAAMPERRDTFAAFALGGRIYAVGGRTTGDVGSPEVYVYTPSTDRWTKGPPTKWPHLCHVAATIGSRAYVVGTHPWCSNATEEFTPRRLSGPNAAMVVLRDGAVLEGEMDPAERVLIDTDFGRATVAASDLSSLDLWEIRPDRWAETRKAVERLAPALADRDPEVAAKAKRELAGLPPASLVRLRQIADWWGKEARKAILAVERELRTSAGGAEELRDRFVTKSGARLRGWLFNDSLVLRTERGPTRVAARQIESITWDHQPPSVPKGTLVVVGAEGTIVAGDWAEDEIRIRTRDGENAYAAKEAAGLEGVGARVSLKIEGTMIEGMLAGTMVSLTTPYGVLRLPVGEISQLHGSRR